MCFTAKVEIGGGSASPTEETEHLCSLLATLRLFPADLLPGEAPPPAAGQDAAQSIIRKALLQASELRRAALFTTLPDAPRHPDSESIWAELGHLLSCSSFAWRLTRPLPGDDRVYSVLRAGGGILRQPLQIVVDKNGIPAIHPHAATIYERADGTWPDVLEICRQHSLINRPMPYFAAPLPELVRLTAAADL